MNIDIRPSKLPSIIKTPRFTLRPFEPKDRDILYSAIMDTMDLLTPWLPWAELYKTRGPEFAQESIANFAAEFESGHAFNFACFAGDKFVGVVGLVRPEPQEKTIEVGYWCVKTQQGRGYITEAVNAIARYAFRWVGVNVVYIICDEQNVRSAAVAERLHATLEQVARDIGLVPGRVYKKYVLMSCDVLPELEVAFA